MTWQSVTQPVGDLFSALGLGPISIDLFFSILAIALIVLLVDIFRLRSSSSNSSGGASPGEGEICRSHLKARFTLRSH